jgi:hypothetical protein
MTTPTQHEGFAVVETITRQLWNGGQNADYEEVVRIGKTRLRICVHVDSYAFQAYGRIYVWSDEKWSLIHSIPGERLCVDLKLGYTQEWKRADEAERATFFARERGQLLDVACAILDIS